MSDVGIVGGGVLGLSLALRLSQQGHRVTIIEAAPEVGGLASADDIGGVRWDRFYHVILGSDTRLRALLDEIGLGDQLAWATTRTGFYVKGKWHSMSSALDFLRFPPLSLIEKFRLGLTILGASRIRDWQRLEETTSVEWLTRWSGKRTVEAVWLPLLRSKLGPHAEEASAAFIWAILVRMYGARQAGSKKESMGYVEGGYDRVLPQLRAYVENAGVRILTGAPVISVATGECGPVVKLHDGMTHEFDNVVMTVSCPRIADMCEDLTEAEKRRLRSVVYQGVVCPSFVLRRPLRGYYVTNITDSDLPFTGVIEMSALVDRKWFDGNHLVYLPRYLSQSDPMWNASNDEIADSFFAALQRMVPELKAEDVVARRVSRAREVLAVSTLRYSTEHMPPLRTSVPNVFVANSAQIAQGTLNVDETVGLAERQAQELRSLLTTPVVRLSQHA